MLHASSTSNLVPGPRATTNSKLSPPLAELLILNVVAAWVSFYLAFGDKARGSSGHRLEALLLLVLALAGHAGMGASQFRFAADSGVAMGLIGVPCLLASLLLLHSDNVLLRSLLHASLLCSGSVALQHLACLPISDIPSRSTPLTRISTLGAKLGILAVRLLLPWPDRPFSVLALLLHEGLLWGVVEVPLFTASFTLGEAMMLVQALALTTADALCCTALEAGLGPWVSGPSSLRGNREATLVVLQCGLIGAIASGAVILPLFCRDVRERRDATGVLQRHSYSSPPHHSLLHIHHDGHLYSSVPQSSSSSSGGLMGGSSMLSLNGHLNGNNGGVSTSLRGEGGGGASSRGPNANANAGQGPTNNSNHGGGGGGGTGAAALEGGGHSSVGSTHTAAPQPPSPRSPLLNMAAFLAVFGAYVGAVLLPWIAFMIHQNPLTWVLHFVLSDEGRLKLCVAWVLLLLLFTHGVVPFSHLLKLRRILVRKLFHLLAVIMFLPATISQPRFLSLAYGVALGALLIIEYIRMSRKALPLGHAVHRYYSHFLDERDMGNLVVTHIYLLLGCAFPLWVGYLTQHGEGQGAGDGKPRPNVFVPYAGVLALGIGDSAAASFGSVFGSHKWPLSNRTLEGSAAMLVCMLMAILLLEQIERTPFLSLGLEPAFGVVLSMVLLSLLEAFTCQIDNLVLPVFGVTLLNLAYRFARDTHHGGVLT